MSDSFLSRSRISFVLRGHIFTSVSAALTHGASLGSPDIYNRVHKNTYDRTIQLPSKDPGT